jgi:diguanylate cyclase (GGDEF)-like protein
MEVYGDDRAGFGGLVTSATGMRLGAVQRLASVRQWGVWTLPAKPRALVLLIDVAAVVVGLALLAGFELRLADVRTFALFLGCAAVSVEATRRVSERGHEVSQDIMAVWLVPIAVLAGPLYALVATALVMWQTQRRVRRLMPMQRVLNASAHGLASVAAAFAFQAGSKFTGEVALPDQLAAAGAGVLLAAALTFVLVNMTLVSSVIRMVAPTTNWRKLFLSRESVNMTTAEACGAVAVVGTWSLSAWLVPVVVAPMVLLQRGLSFEELQAQARTDTTTGLPRVEAWRKLADRVFTRARTDGTNLSLLMLDIDHFKALNDRHGHLTGDSVLSAVATAIQGAIRPGDLPGRYGGEEFSVLLPGADYMAATEVAERVRRTVAGLSLSPVLTESAQSCTLQVTVSVGVTQHTPHVASFDQLIARADQAMYAAKRAGRNRVQGLVDVSAESVAIANADTSSPSSQPGDTGAWSLTLR